MYVRYLEDYINFYLILKIYFIDNRILLLIFKVTIEKGREREKREKEIQLYLGINNREE